MESSLARKAAGLRSTIAGRTSKAVGLAAIVVEVHVLIGIVDISILEVEVDVGTA